MIKTESIPIYIKQHIDSNLLNQSIQYKRNGRYILIHLNRYVIITESVMIHIPIRENQYILKTQYAVTPAKGSNRNH